MTETLNYDKEYWATPCPKYDCRKAACKCGLKYVNIPTSLGDDSEGSKAAPKNGAYCNALVVYEANGHVYIYSQEGVPTLIDVDASDISTLEQEIIKAQKDIAGFREELDEFVHGFNTVADMKSTDTLSNGDYVETYGFYTLNDGGGAKYKIRTKTNSDVIDDMFIFQLSHNVSLIAELVLPDSLHSRQVGLKGDGTTDETNKLNTFFEKSVSCNKRIVDKGLYKTSEIVYIKGLWRQNSGNNGQKRVIFEDASIYYTGAQNGASVVLYNMFKAVVSGLCVARNSNHNYVQIVGCWHLDYRDWDIQSLTIDNSTDNLVGKSYATTADEYVSGSDIYVNGTLNIGCASGSYNNVILFYNSIFNGRNNDYCVRLLGNSSKQDIQFISCDLSYADNAVFYVDENQVGGCSIFAVGCYFDSAIQIFDGDDKKGVLYTNIASLSVANTNLEKQNVKFIDYNKNGVIGNLSPFGNNLPIGNVNYAINGDLSYQQSLPALYDSLMGSNSAAWTKSYVDDPRSINGKARRMVLNIDGPGGFAIRTVSAPRTDMYSAFLHFRVISGTFDNLSYSFKGQYMNIGADYIGNDEVVIINNKNQVKVEEGSSLDFSIQFDGAKAGLTVDFYEVGVIPGNTYMPNMPLDSRAKISGA